MPPIHKPPNPTALQNLGVKSLRPILMLRSLMLTKLMRQDQSIRLLLNSLVLSTHL